MLIPRSTPLVVKLVAGLAIAACAALGACSGSNGVDPTCTFNVGPNGIEASPDGCQQFAKCDKGDAINCCVDDKGNQFTGDALALCLFSYGGGPAPTGSSSSSSSSSGGGAGGGAP